MAKVATPHFQDVLQFLEDVRTIAGNEAYQHIHAILLNLNPKSSTAPSCFAQSDLVTVLRVLPGYPALLELFASLFLLDGKISYWKDTSAVTSSRGLGRRHTVLEYLVDDSIINIVLREKTTNSSKSSVTPTMIPPKELQRLDRDFIKNVLCKLTPEEAKFVETVLDGDKLSMHDLSRATEIILANKDGPEQKSHIELFGKLLLPHYRHCCVSVWKKANGIMGERKIAVRKEKEWKFYPLDGYFDMEDEQEGMTDNEQELAMNIQATSLMDLDDEDMSVTKSVAKPVKGIEPPSVETVDSVVETVKSLVSKVEEEKAEKARREERYRKLVERSSETVRTDRAVRPASDRNVADDRDDKSIKTERSEAFSLKSSKAVEKELRKRAKIRAARDNAKFKAASEISNLEEAMVKASKLKKEKEKMAMLKYQDEDEDFDEFFQKIMRMRKTSQKEKLEGLAVSTVS